MKIEKRGFRELPQLVSPIKYKIIPGIVGFIKSVVNVVKKIVYQPNFGP